VTFGLVLDPPEANTAFNPNVIVGTHSQLDLNSGPIRVDQAGIDWGDAAITAFMAEQGRIGASPVDYLIPNRTIVIPLAVFTDELSGVTYDQAKRMLTAKIGRIQAEGGVLKRTTDTGAYSPIYADIVDAALNFPDVWGETAEFETNVRLTLTALPDFYGQEITLDTVTSTAFGDFGGVLQQNGSQAFIAGDFPARTRIVVTNGAGGAEQHAMFGGFRSRYSPPQDGSHTAYRNAAPLILDSSNLYAGTILTTLVSTGLTGATNGTAGRQQGLAQGTWVPVVDLAVPHVPSLWDNLTHIGTYRVLARVYTTNGNAPGSSDPPILLRLAWSTSPAPYKTINPMVQIPGSQAFFIMDLGQVILPQLPGQPNNPSTWAASIQAYGTPGLSAKDVYIDRLWFVPLDEGSWFPTAPPLLVTGVQPLVGSDTFDTMTAGAGVNGRTAASGGTWSSSGGTGDLVAVAQPNGFALTRTTVSDGPGNPTAGRFAVLSYSATNVEVQCDFYFGGALTSATFFNQAIFARYNAGKSCILVASYSNGAAALNLWVAYGAGLVAQLGSAPILNYHDTWMTLNLRVLFGGQAFGQLFTRGGQSPIVVLQGWHQELANPSGSLATGNVGINDHAPGTGAASRYYDNFSVRSANSDAVLAAPSGAGPAELRSDGFFRDGIPMSRRTGDYPRLPVSGLEGRPVEMLLKTSRGDLASVADSGFDPFTAQVNYRPCWLLGQ